MDFHDILKISTNHMHWRRSKTIFIISPHTWQPMMITCAATVQQLVALIKLRKHTDTHSAAWCIYVSINGYLLMAGSRNNLIVRVGLDIYSFERAFACSCTRMAHLMCIFHVSYILRDFWYFCNAAHIDYTIKYYYISAASIFFLFFIQSIADAPHTKILCNFLSYYIASNCNNVCWAEKAIYFLSLDSPHS
jgi:hypothetical protein